MNAQGMDWTSGFPEVGYDQWRALAEQALKGADFERRLVSRTHEGFAVQPLYGAADRKTEPPRAYSAQPGSWDIRQFHDHPDPRACNEALRKDLDNGVDSLLLALDAEGAQGALVRSLDDMDLLLAGVDLTRVPLALLPGADFASYAALLIGLASRRGWDLGELRLSFGADPLGTLAATGVLPQGLETAYAQMADLAAFVHGDAPGSKALRLDMAPYHEAGADGVQSLACLLASAATYARQLADRENMSPTDSLALMEASLPVDGDLFLTMAQMRAARRLWARFAEACGIAEEGRHLTLHAITARRVMTRRDPWVNLLRATATTFGAALGGADSITALPMDAVSGLSTEFSHRVARNLQLVLREESNLGRVADPAGGSWYVEHLTDELASRAWALFQEIEGQGGLVTLLENGELAKRLADTRAARRRNLAKRKEPITGVSEFPNIAEKKIETEPVDRERLRAAAVQGGAPVSDSVETGGGAMTVALAFSTGAGSTVATMRAAFGTSASHVEPLPSHRLSEPFEALRQACEVWEEKTGVRPKIFLANLGRVAEHTARASFAKNYFEAGGIETIPNSGFSDPEAMVAAFRQSGATLAVLCGSDAQYEEQVSRFAPALKQAGCQRLLLAGKPGEREASDRAAGVDQFIALGDDLLDALSTILSDMGVIGS
ncbi:methylmalonyl-CoA mutase family protein [Magnetospira thiophila]